MSNGGNGKSSQGSLSANVIGGIAALLLIGYILVLGFAFFRIDVAEGTWTRMLFLIGGIESLAFAAAGYLFGQEVRRERTEQAEQKAKDAQTKGEGLRDQIEMLESAGPGLEAQGSTSTLLQALARTARQYFP